MGVTIHTNCGPLEVGDLPDHFVPAFCVKCGERVGWSHDNFTEEFIGVCDECAALISQDNSEDPTVEL